MIPENMSAHTCYCFVCGRNVKEAEKTIRALEQRIEDLKDQNRVLHGITIRRD